ncbi:MAG: hypothetical protein ABIR05_01125 [Luteimonas sp.]
MKHNTLNLAIVAALAAGLALAGCKKHDATTDATAPTTPAPMGESTPATPPAANEFVVTTVDLGSAVGTDNRITTPGISFAGTDTIHASVATNGTTGGNLTGKWTFQDGQVVDTQEKSVPAGAQVTDFSISKPDGWPAGHYKLEVWNNGMVVQTREFDVK